MRPARRRIAVAAVLLSLLAALARAEPTRAEDATVPDAWRWLSEMSLPEDGLYAAPALTPAQRALADRLRRSTLALALTPARGRPDEASLVGTGVVIRSDGLVAASWQVLSRVDPYRWLWARAPDGGWMRAIPTGATWWADVGLVRLVTLRRQWPAVAWGDASKRDVRQPFLCVGTGLGRFPVASSGRLSAVVFFDPEEEDGRLEVDRPWKGGGSKRSSLIALHYEEGVAAEGSAGAPVFDEAGRCVGLVTRVGLAQARETRVVVRPAAYLRPMLDDILRQATFDPPDLGVRWNPAPVGHGVPAPVPEALAKAREEAKGGAIVGYVLQRGPANRVLWEGDVVLEIEGRPVFGEVYESIALAMLSLTPGVPTDLVVLRGGRRRGVQVPTFRGRALWEDYAAEHALRAGGLR